MAGSDTAQMDDALVQAYARMTVHEAAIEIMMANWVAAMPEGSADEFLDAFVSRSRSTWVTGDPAVHDDVVRQIVSDSIEVTEHFAEKVRRRSREIRKELSQRG